VYNQDHVNIGTLGPADGVYSAATYIKCITKAWDDAWWYRMMIPANSEPSAASA
jgi:hypothetical protein